MAGDFGQSDLPAALASSADFGYDQQVIRRGVTVRLHSLVAGALYNGAIGIVRARDDEEEERARCAGGRQPVLLHGSDKLLSVLPGNLEVIGPPLSANFVELFRGDLASGDVPMPIKRESFSLWTEVRDVEHACSLDVACGRCGSRSAPLYLVLEELAGPQLLEVECTDCAVLIAAEEGVPSDMADITAFNDQRYRGVFSAISALRGHATSGLMAAPVHPPGLPGPLHPGISEQFYDY